MKKRVFYLDFIRALSVVFIIIFHFNCSIGSHGIYNNVSSAPIIFYEYKNGNLGQIGVSLFFIISGAGLMISNYQNINMKEYIKKRIFAIFPMFYFAYFCVTCYYFVRYASLNPFGVGRSNASFLLTILGMDGYLSPVIPNFYFIGEWFLGAIILFYFLFPILRKLLLKVPHITVVCVLILYIITTTFYSFESFPIEYFIGARICEFFFGMYSVVYFPEMRRWQLCIAGMIAAIWFVWYIPLAQIHKTVVMGIALYVIFAYIGQHISGSFRQPFYSISKYSYQVYLLHHVIIEQICTRFDNMPISLFEIYFLLLTCFIFIVAIVVIFNILYSAVKKTICNYVYEK